MEKENEEPQKLSSLQDGGFVVVLDYNGTDIDISNQLGDVHLSDKHTTMLDEQNFIQSWEILKEENTNLKEQLHKVNSALAERIGEMKKFKDVQAKWIENTESNRQKAKEEIMRLRDQIEEYEKRIQAIVTLLETLKKGHPELKTSIDNLIQKTKEGNLEITEETDVPSAEEKKKETNDVQTERKQEGKLELSANTETKEQAEQTSLDTEVVKLNKTIAEMSEQLKCKDDQIVLIANELENLKKEHKSMEKMVLVTEETTQVQDSSLSDNSKDVESSSMREELSKVNSINVQLNKNLQSFEKARTVQHSEIEGLKADLLRYQRMQEEKSKEFDKLRSSIAKLQTDKDELTQSLANYQPVKAPPSSTQSSASSTQVLVGSSPATADKSYKREQSNEEETVQNLLVFFRSERQKSSNLQEKLTEASNRVHVLEVELLMTKQELETKNSKLGNEMSEREKQHKITVKELNKKLDNLSQELIEAQEPRYQSTGENMRALRSQVMALMSELEEMNNQVADANVQVLKQKEKIKNLELKNSVLASEQYNQSVQDTAIIDRLQKEIQILNENQKGYEKVIEERNNLIMKYKQLEASYKEMHRSYEESRRNTVDEKEFSQMTVELISSKEALIMRDEDIKKLSDCVRQLRQFEDQCTALAAQAELYKMDFEAEREAREKAHNEKDNLSEEIKAKERELEQLREELNPAGRAALEDLQRRYGMERSPPVHPHTAPVDVGQTYGRPQDYYPHPADQYPRGTARPVPQDYECPICMTKFPDIDSLQIHVMDCIN